MFTTEVMPDAFRGDSLAHAFHAAGLTEKLILFINGKLSQKPAAKSKIKFIFLILHRNSICSWNTFCQSSIFVLNQIRQK